MADPYVIFPGVAGNNIQTDDVNLLDSNTAHNYQGFGSVQYRQGAGGIAQVLGVDGATVGGNVMEYYSTGAQASVRTSRLLVMPLLEGSEYVGSVRFRIRSDGTAARFRGGVEFASGGSFVGGGLAGDWIDCVPGVWVTVDAIPQTAPAGADAAVLFIESDNATLGDYFQWDVAVVREGTVPAFVRSIRILESLYEETIPADMPIVYAADGTPLTVGEGWAGNGYSYNRYDGPDASAPLVASFNAADVPVATQLPG